MAEITTKLPSIPYDYDIEANPGMLAPCIKENGAKANDGCKTSPQFKTYPQFKNEKGEGLNFYFGIDSSEITRKSSLPDPKQIYTEINNEKKELDAKFKLGVSNNYIFGGIGITLIPSPTAESQAADLVKEAEDLASFAEKHQSCVEDKSKSLLKSKSEIVTQCATESAFAVVCAEEDTSFVCNELSYRYLYPSDDTEFGGREIEDPFIPPVIHRSNPTLEDAKDIVTIDLLKLMNFYIGAFKNNEE
ncbi:hypothetical protein BVY03_05310 [bacterium K02(2017)]|nr:hypothetical protein BVY03_05310 [bacterium K02(2017)]